MNTSNIKSLHRSHATVWAHSPAFDAKDLYQHDDTVDHGHDGHANYLKELFQDDNAQLVKHGTC